jgi:hypothetical protein
VAEQSERRPCAQLLPRVHNVEITPGVLAQAAPPGPPTKVGLRPPRGASTALVISRPSGVAAQLPSLLAVALLYAAP